MAQTLTDDQLRAALQQALAAAGSSVDFDTSGTVTVSGEGDSTQFQGS